MREHIAQEHIAFIKQTTGIFLAPLALFVASIFLADPAWRVATFVAVLWYFLPAVRGRVVVAYVALASSAVLWILLSGDISLAFGVAILPLLLAACIPGKKRGAGSDFDPAPGVTR